MAVVFLFYLLEFYYNKETQLSQVREVKEVKEVNDNSFFVSVKGVFKVQTYVL